MSLLALAANLDDSRRRYALRMTSQPLPFPPETEIFTALSGTLRREVVLARLRELSTWDRRRRLFGAESHHYRLNPPATPAQVKAFEAQHKISLPVAYRRFIVNIGDGGAGPFYGLAPLSQLEVDASGKPRVKSLVLCDRGCSQSHLLVVSGLNAGDMWSDDRADGFGLGPCELWAGRKHRRLSFTTWYREWLKDPLRAQHQW